MSKVIASLLGCLSAVCITTLGGNINSWQYWVGVLTVAAAYIVGIESE